MKSATADACAYILTCLIQRMNKEKPGLISDIIDGVKHDQKAIPKNTPDMEHIDSIFKEALKLLTKSGTLLETKNTS